MKIIVQIPCPYEESILTQTIGVISRQIDGVDAVEVLAVDDGSMNETVWVASKSCADQILRHKSNKGIAPAFYSGVEAALRKVRRMEMGEGVDAAAPLTVAHSTIVASGPGPRARWIPMSCPVGGEGKEA